MVTFKQLIVETDFSKVWQFITRHYEIRKEISIDNFKDNYNDLYEKLSALAPTENTKNMYIYINVFKDDGNDDYYCPDSFEENNSELYFDVCGKDDELCGYSIVASSFEDWLSFYIDEKTLAKLSCPNIIAHCLLEMTFFGFEQTRDEEGRLIVD
ncbi:MAG: DUF6557 family protein [Lutisporaceae bacterium]